MAAPAPPVANKFKEATAKLILVLEREWLTRRGVPLPAPSAYGESLCEAGECIGVGGSGSRVGGGSWVGSGWNGTLLSTRPRTAPRCLDGIMPLARAALTAQQKAEIEECFTLMDSDGSGAIDVREIIQAFGSLGFVISKDAIEELMLEADPDGSGELEFDEVRHWGET